MIDKEKIKKKNIELRSVTISIRTFPSYAKYLDKESISPSALFNESIRELMEEAKN